MRLLWVAVLSFSVALLLSRFMSGAEPLDAVNLPQRLIAANDACVPSEGTCYWQDGDAEISLSFHGELKPLHSFRIRMMVDGLEPVGKDAILLNFSMTNMEMGINRYRLIQQADGSWQSDAMLPVCTDERMDWVVTVWMTTEHERLHLERSFTLIHD